MGGCFPLESWRCTPSGIKRRCPPSPSKGETAQGEGVEGRKGGRGERRGGRGGRGEGVEEREEKGGRYERVRGKRGRTEGTQFLFTP